MIYICEKWYLLAQFHYRSIPVTLTDELHDTSDRSHRNPNAVSRVSRLFPRVKFTVDMLEKETSSAFLDVQCTGTQQSALFSFLTRYRKKTRRGYDFHCRNVDQRKIAQVGNHRRSLKGATLITVVSKYLAIKMSWKHRFS